MKILLKKYVGTGAAFLGIMAIAVSCHKPSASSRQGSGQRANEPVWVAKKYGYKPSKTLLNDLIHTRLEVKFDWEKQHLTGNAQLTFRPYFYPQDTLILDAKGFDVKSVSLIGGAALKYRYDGKKLNIALGKTYQKSDSFVVEIDYVAKPNELPVTEHDAIHADKGLYFINPTGSEPDKPRQIWSQGEPESSSCWFPTIDSPNEKSTEEIYIIVEDKYKTLSNGEFIYSKKNNDGTRTDYWKQDKPHAPYLFMVAVGEFEVVKDKWRGKEVSYYVEPAFGRYARDIFGRTPEMMEFFSNKLRYPFVWDKYASVVVRDYVSGAMENTSATVFMEQVQRTSRELLDKNWDDIIAHELFHHWFGDLVTCESWANLPLNESFATYAEYLWLEHKLGKDAADHHRLDEMEQYFYESAQKQEPIIRFYNKSPDDMFDSHSYAKGGCVLHMLRKYVGDDAFFESLNRYLKANEFKTVEIHQLRLAFEAVTGEDLNWFFNQWFLSPGHPEIQVTDTFLQGKLFVKVWQKQDSLYTPIYRLPVKLDVWVNNQRIRYDIVVDKQSNEFTFDLPQEPDLVVFDGEQQLLARINHKKSNKRLVYQYTHSDNYILRAEALEKLGQFVSGPLVARMMADALNDPYWKIRENALNIMDTYKGEELELVKRNIEVLADKDPNTSVRARSIDYLGKHHKQEYTPIYVKGLNDSSYYVVSASLAAYMKSGAPDAEQKIQQFQHSDNPDVVVALSEFYTDKGDSTRFAWFGTNLKKLKGEDLYLLIRNYGKLLPKCPVHMKKEGISVLENFARNSKSDWIRLAGYQALGELKTETGVKELRASIKANEKNERLLRIYSMIE